MSKLENQIEYLKSKVKESRCTEEVMVNKDEVEDVIKVLEDCSTKYKEASNAEVEECLDIELDMVLKEIKEDKEKLDIDEVVSLLKRASQQIKGENKIVHIFNEDECGKDEIYCMMYICPNCASDQVLEFDKFCSKCGAKIIWEL